MRPLAEKDTLTAEEQKTYDAHVKALDDLDAQIKRAERVNAEETALNARDPAPRPQPGDPAPTPAANVRIPNPGFTSMSELLLVARQTPSDRRIRALMEMNTGSSGGIAVPDEFIATFLAVPASAAIVRPRATMLPQGASPDAEVSMPALDQGSGQNMFGGVEVGWSGEGDDSSDTDAVIREVSLQPKEVTACITVTNKLLRNWAGAGATIEGLLRNAQMAAEDLAFLRGNGVNRPLGAQVADCVKAVNREQANEIHYIDLVNMEDEHNDEGNSVWVVAKRAVHQLRVMEDNEGHLIWTDPKGLMPGTLMGRPVVVSYRSPALGSKGDIFLSDFKYYLIRDGVGLTVAASEHALFKSNKTLIKVFRSVDGQPWLKDPLEQEDGNSYSPFVTLDVPA